jgi:alkylation response protein AidB-like acyl-CoA dehydrogenase
MNVYSDERLALREAVSDFLAKHCHEQQVRHDMEQPAGFDRATWSVFAGQLGLCGLGVPERLGGSGGDFLDVAVVAEQFGASLACLPYLSSVVLAQTALAGAGDDAAEWISAIAAGRLTGAVAMVTDQGQGRWDETGVGLTGTASPDGEGWRVDGVADYVVDGATADVVVAFARTPAGLSQFVIDGHAPGLVREPLPTMDQTRRLARLVATGVPARLLGGAGQAPPVFERVRDTAATALSVEAVGGIRRALDLSVEHAKTREQFGRKIGSFQAIKHRCADMFVDAESARAVAYAAAAAQASGGPPPAGGGTSEASTLASAAKALCSAAYQRTVRSMIQIHGGMGFTWEHPAHLYFKRAASDALLFGDVLFHRQRVAVSLRLLQIGEHGL